MQDKDVITKEFFLADARVADFINGFLFEGHQLVRPEDIKEADSAEFGKTDHGRLKQFIEENGEELSSVESDAYEMMAVMSHSEELSDMRSKFQKGGKVDMCKALKDWMEESRLEGETRFAALTEKLLEEKRTEDLSRAVNDVNYRAVLYREFRI